jgi:hypothetical protein
VRGYNWHLLGAIKNYIVTSNSNPEIELTSTDYSATTPKLYYPVVPQNSGTASTSGAVPISCSLTMSDGSTRTVSGSLHLVAPTVQVSGSTPGQLQIHSPVLLSSGQFESWISDGYNIVWFPLSPYGLVANASAVTLPTPFTSGSTGWLQVLVSDTFNAMVTGTYMGIPDLSSTNANDGGFPYGNDNGATCHPGNEATYTNDSPGMMAVYPQNTEIDRIFSASMYFMWRSDVAGSIWVPLKVVNWGFACEADWSISKSAFDWNNKHLKNLKNPPSAGPVSITAPSKEPSWASTFKYKY